ncbi:hypothetical protein ACHQM5_004253 [Ranunculus cassubicifolius]
MAPSILIPLLLLLLQITSINGSTPKTYVVYMGSTTPKNDPQQILKQNHHMLTLVHAGRVEQAQASHVCSYTHGFTGFAAKLTEEQALEMTKMDGVVSVFPNEKRKLHTTHSWDFMGLVNDEQMEIPGYSTKNQENVIIAFIDTGWLLHQIWATFRIHSFIQVATTTSGKI